MVRLLLLGLLFSALLQPPAVRASQVDSATVPNSRPLYAEPVDRAPAWPSGRYFRVVFSGIASDTIIVNGYRAAVVMLDNATANGLNYAIARLPSDAAVTRGFITFMVTAKTEYGYTPAVPLKIVL
jgi:hypothetical protein